ncbi:Hypothetical predicted protein [Octopus vulgaris]|uniref:Uncharacterized protein n=1 Tax=Octopus vulgaris TaxID=6645 RepID=A0AA36BX80_OCTVU|nr:Hypothetical predicted protein [Octopus vulgaris]
MEQRLCISRLHGHIPPPEAAELTQQMITIDTIDVVNVHPIQLTTTGDPHKLCISRLHGHIHPPEAAELTQHMIPIDTIDVVNVHTIQLTTTGDPHKSRFTF